MILDFARPNCPTIRKFCCASLTPSSPRGLYALPADEADITGLWQEAFGDTPEFIRFYLDQRLTAENTLMLLH